MTCSTQKQFDDLNNRRFPVGCFLPIKEAGTVGPLPHAFIQQLANVCFTGSTEYSHLLKHNVLANGVCVVLIGLMPFLVQETMPSCYACAKDVPYP